MGHNPRYDALDMHVEALRRRFGVDVSFRADGERVTIKLQGKIFAIVYSIDDATIVVDDIEAIANAVDRHKNDETVTRLSDMCIIASTKINDGTSIHTGDDCPCRDAILHMCPDFYRRRTVVAPLIWNTRNDGWVPDAVVPIPVLSVYTPTRVGWITAFTRTSDSVVGDVIIEPEYADGIRKGTIDVHLLTSPDSPGMVDHACIHRVTNRNT